MTNPFLRARLRAPLATALTAAVGLSGAAVLAAPASAAPDGSRVVISEVYGGGGNSGATFRNDFVELYNPTGAAVDLTGTSVQYRSATGEVNPTGVVPLTGAIAAHATYLVGLAGGTTGAALPTPNQTDTSLNMSAANGTVFLANQTTALTAPRTGSLTGDPAILDLVGFGTSNTYEGAAVTGLGNTVSAQRTATGADTDNNAVDLTVATPTPGAGPVVVPPPADPVDATVEQVQGTGAASPLVGEPVTTDGVVTASYPTGGFSGFYLQQPTGTDPAASDGVFVFLGSAAPATAYPQVGQTVEVTGTVTEFNGLTEVSAAPADVATTGTGSVAPTSVEYPGADGAREALEGMLVRPQGPFTVTDDFHLNDFAEIGLAAGTEPLFVPTEVVDAQDTAAVAAVTAQNAARAVALDDGASTNYLRAPGNAVPLPWLSPATPIRVGADATFTAPMVLDFRNGIWKLQPTAPLAAGDPAPVTFENTRQAAPSPVGGSLKVASFNVLNYFTETGEDYEATGASCTSFDDRTGEPVTVNTCPGSGPRGAWDDADLARQQAKIVAAINGLDADVLSLEEIENSAWYAGEDHRDDALATLVAALNADAGTDRWAFVPSPAPADRPALADEDVIRTAFIYQKAAAEPVGPSHILVGSDAFANAREPLGQVFEPAGGAANQRFLVVVNHFKSKGSGVDDGTGQGNANPDRIRQASALQAFVAGLRRGTGVDATFLTGDFNSYTQEDPLQVLYDGGYTDIGSALHPDEHTYLFDGLVGSLDHVLANPAALALVQDAHVWNINSVESVALEYSRFGYNATDFYAPTPYRASDHDPLLVGFTPPAPEPAAARVTVTVSPTPVLSNKTRAVVAVSVTAPDEDPTGTARVLLDGRLVGTTTLVSGQATLTLDRIKAVGSHTVTVQYSGDDRVAAGTATATFTVVKK